MCFQRGGTGRLCFLALVAYGLAGKVTGEEWPQLLGPRRDGTYSGNDVSVAWPKEGPRTIWQKKVGQGFSGPVVFEGKVVLFHRIDREEIIQCLDANDGRPIWRFAYPTSYRDDFGMDEGPRATPTIFDGQVYTVGAEGMLHCVEFATGKTVWAVDTKRRFSPPKGFFGMASSPWVDSKRVYLNLGGSGTGIVAFDRKTGEVLWTATNDEASYSSPVGARFGDRSIVFFFTRSGLVGVEADTGKLRWNYPWRSRTHASVNAATPIVVEDLVFLSASYETGAVLLRLHQDRVDPVWSSDDSLSNHYATSVYREGYLYGFHGRQEHGPSFRCVELRTGKVKWSADNLAAGTVTVAGESLLILLEDGRLMAAPASPDGFKSVGQAQILPANVRAYPALANGRLYGRSKDTLVCIDLKK